MPGENYSKLKLLKLACVVMLSLSWAIALPQYNLVEYKLIQRNPAGVAACYSTTFGLK